jgi:hypothetical protein
VDELQIKLKSNIENRGSLQFSTVLLSKTNSMRVINFDGISKNKRLCSMTELQMAMDCTFHEIAPPPPHIVFISCEWLLWIVKEPVLSLPSKLLMEGSKKHVCQNHLCLLDTSSSLMISLPLVSPSVQFSVLLRVQTSPYQIHTRGAIFLKGVHEPLFLSLPPPLLSPIVFKPLDPCMPHSL